MRTIPIDIDQSKRVAQCPQCHCACPRHSTGTRKVRDIGKIVVVKFSKHWCANCRRHFSICDRGFVGKGRLYTNSFRRAALQMMETGKTCKAVAQALGFPLNTLWEWVNDARTG